jgi:uncharacterized protein (TIGR00288 family)
VSDSPHAALLIDFDNVTMGMRSDLSKELKSLLDSDVIKGKVSVQRAYADWRRYPQYIVPLSEASVDLIFAPAYGSNKKNATDIRMAIDGMELVFTRPEIGTYILLTGDSDFSSLVLKLKEYGKYVIGVGIQESSSDILVQNCDEYYSYTTLTGLRKTTESGQKTQDPWVLTTQALKRMKQRDDVMRSDRLKQVMQEIDSSFDEGSFGFSKFSKFLAEASSRGLVQLRKMENGQYEVALPRGGGGDRDDRGGRRDRDRSRNGRGGRRERGRGRSEPRRDAASSREERSETPLQDAYDLLTTVLEELRDQGRQPVRDSDVKRKLLERDRSFDETELGFSKFSLFLDQAAEHDVIALGRTETGNFQVSLPGGGAAAGNGGDAEAPSREEPRERAGTSNRGGRGSRDRGGRGDRGRGGREAAEEAAEESRAAGVGADASRDGDGSGEEDSGQTVLEMNPSELGTGGKRLGPRRGSTRRRGADDEPPPLFEGQVVRTPSGGGSGSDEEAEEVPAEDEAAAPAPDSAARGSAAVEGGLDAQALGLPTDGDSIVRYMANRYRGVGEKTAEALVERFGEDVFDALQSDPDAVREVITPRRAEQVLEAWEADYERRVSRRSRG